MEEPNNNNNKVLRNTTKVVAGAGKLYFRFWGWILTTVIKFIIIINLIALPWVYWGYSNCLMGEKLDITKDNIIEVIKELKDLKEIKYAESIMVKEEYNVIIKCENKEYHTTMNKDDIELLKVAGALVPTLKPKETKPLHISIPIITSAVVVFFVFFHRRKT